MTTLVIGDIAGQFDTLQALLNKVSEVTKIIAVGDLIDRGPKSREVVEFFMDNPDSTVALMGNHEHMMLDYLAHKDMFNGYNFVPGSYYGNDISSYQGGRETLESFGGDILEEVQEWMRTRDLYCIEEVDNQRVFISHAFLHPALSLEQATNLDSEWGEPLGRTIIWNRREPDYRQEYTLQIAGHNSHMGLRYFRDPVHGLFALGIDTSIDNILTGYEIETQRIYQQEYI